MPKIVGPMPAGGTRPPKPGAGAPKGVQGHPAVPYPRSPMPPPTGAERVAEEQALIRRNNTRARKGS